MRIARLRIENFRGIKQGTIHFNQHTVLMGTNNVGKSTVIDAISIVLGKERMVRSITEHDFYGSNPTPDTRIKIIVTIVDFINNDPDYNSNWFRDGRAVPKWWSQDEKIIKSFQASADDLLCVDIGYTARFDLDTLSVETLRYFHDDDSIVDPFLYEVINKVPGKLLSELGYYSVPVSRTWDKLLSFNSEIFRRLVTSIGGIPSVELLDIRNQLRIPSTPLESTGELGKLIDRVNTELKGFLTKTPEIKLRITSTDIDSLLQAITPHFQFNTSSLIPAGRAGSGLLSLQIIMLLLELGNLKNQSDENFLLTIEEPELHIPYGIQKRLVYRTQSIAQQTIVTSHSSNIVAFYPSTSIFILDNKDGNLIAQPLLENPLNNSTPNSIRKLFNDNRHELVSSLMQEYLLIPEGRIDFEWFRLLIKCTETRETSNFDYELLPFGSLFGLIPTHNASVMETYNSLSRVHPQILIIVDGDGDGDRYIENLLTLGKPPKIIIQWPRGWVIEDILIWIIEANEDAKREVEDLLECNEAYPLSIKLKKESNIGGIKGNYLIYEDINSIIFNYNECIIRARKLLDGFVKLVFSGDYTEFSFEVDDRSTSTCAVRLWKQ